MLSFIKKQNFYFILALIVILLFITQQFIFIINDTYPGGTDGHFYRCIRYYDQILYGRDNSIRMIQFPPLTYLITMISFKLFGISYESAKLLLILFSLIFLFSMYGIGKELGGDTAGFITMAASAGSPPILDLSGAYLLEYPQTALTALAFYLLIKSNGFRDRKYSIFLGIALALSFLAKWSTAFFLALPVIWMSLSVIKEAPKKPLRFSVLFFYLLVLSSITLYYFSRVQPYEGGYEKYWLIFYIIGIIIPSLFWLIADYFLIKKEAKDTGTDKNTVTLAEKQKIPKESNSASFPALESSSSKSLSKSKLKPEAASCRISNFGWFMALFSIITGVWYFWAAVTVKIKLAHETSVDHRVQNFIMNTIVSYLYDGLNFFPFYQVLALIGLILLVLRFKEYCSKSFIYYLIPMNIVFIWMVLLKIGFEDYRYHLSIIIFMSALAGFWTEKLKLLKIPVSLTVLIAVFISLWGWILFPIGHSERNMSSLYLKGEGMLNFLREERNVHYFKISGRWYPRTVNTNNLRELAQWMTQDDYNLNSDKIYYLLFLYPRLMITVDFFDFIPLYTYDKQRGVYVIWGDWVDSVVTKGEHSYSSPLLEPKYISKELILYIKTADCKAAKALEYHLEEKTKNLLAQYNGEVRPSAQLKTALAEDINRLLKREELLDEVLSVNIDNSPLALNMINKNLEGEALVILNRLIFEEIFKEQITLPFSFKKHMDQMGRVSIVMALRKKNQSPASTAREIEHWFPHASYERKDFEVQPDTIITAYKINRRSVYKLYNDKN